MRINRSGFTIVELAVVIVVIGILAGITLLAYNGIQARTRDDRRKTDVENIEKAMELYYSDNGSYPVPTGSTGSVINTSWYSSGDSSWTMLTNLLVGDQAIDAVPVTLLTPLMARHLAPSERLRRFCEYYWRLLWCRKGQMYIIVYVLEGSTKEKKTDGNCTTKDLGTDYYNAGASYYRNVKGT